MIDATEDTWTCDRAAVHGVWTSEAYAQRNPWGRRWCRAVNLTAWSHCRRCGFPQPDN